MADARPTAPAPQSGADPSAAAAILGSAQEALSAGRVSECYRLIAPLLSSPPPDGKDRSHLAYLQLACALYHTGDLEAARPVSYTHLTLPTICSV